MFGCYWAIQILKGEGTQYSIFKYILSEAGKPIISRLDPG